MERRGVHTNLRTILEVQKRTAFCGPEQASQKNVLEKDYLGWELILSYVARILLSTGERHN